MEATVEMQLFYVSPQSLIISHPRSAESVLSSPRSAAQSSFRMLQELAVEAKLLLPGGGRVPFPTGILRLRKLKTLLLDIPCHVLRYTGPRSRIRISLFCCGASC